MVAPISRPLYHLLITIPPLVWWPCAAVLEKLRERLAGAVTLDMVGRCSLTLSNPS